MAGRDEQVGGLDEGWAALRDGRWESARELFSEAVDVDETPEALEGLSWAAWWQDDAEAMFAARERAFRQYRDRGDAAGAARMATWLGADELDFHGSLAVASGWLDRAGRLLEPLTPGPDHGWLAFHRGYVAVIKGDTEAAEEDGRRAASLGRRYGVPDLEMLGLAIQGATLVSRARVADGMRCLDEASAIALSGEMQIPISGAWTCCFMVTACTRVYDYERAFEWCDRIAEFAERYGSRYMLGFCRAEYATIHMWRGEWDRAERALDESASALAASRPGMASMALVQLAELRRRQGRREECQQLLERVGTSSGALLCQAEIALEDGEARRAADLAERVLRACDPARAAARVPALEILVRAQVQGGRLPEARAVANELERIAESVGTTAMIARAMLAKSIVAAADGEHETAKRLAEDALDGFGACRGRFDGARARIELARALTALGRSSDADREARAAIECLEELGAAVDAERARHLLDSDGSGEPDGPLPVSPRELDVLRLLCAGLTNREIAGRLHISEHTVHRHVNSILRKLDVPTRAAAAAVAARRGIGAGVGE